MKRIVSVSSLALLLLLIALLGCNSKLFQELSPVEAGLNQFDLVDPAGEQIRDSRLNLRSLYQIGEKYRLGEQPAVLPKPRNVLVMSGGGSYGAYSAGVLFGWTQMGNRPEFDVVTGISTGALIAPFAFLGTDYDSQLRELYTTLKQKDIFRLRKTVRTLLFFTDSFADNTPLKSKIETVVSHDLMAKIAGEHAKGRRLYVGTTELDSRRPVYWDMGEIATRGTEEDLVLLRQIILGSTSIPGLFPPVRIPVTVDGKTYEERHVDGGVANALFYLPPVPLPEDANKTPREANYGSNVYILVAGKLYSDPDRIKLSSLNIAANSISTLIYAETRGDLFKLYSACLLTGMNYYISAIPPEFTLNKSSTDFNTEEMERLFEEGTLWSKTGPPWRLKPPGLEPGERPFVRTSTQLQIVESGAKSPPLKTRGPLLRGREVSK